MRSQSVLPAPRLALKGISGRAALKELLADGCRTVGSSPTMSRTLRPLQHCALAPREGRHIHVTWFKGSTVLTSRLETPVLVDAATGRVAEKRQLPWYLRALEISRPLHFGDYGGLPLKLLWAVLDIATIIVLVTGIQLLVRPRGRAA
jgi:uncharacterized iron-regulated membrane protein